MGAHRPLLRPPGPVPQVRVHHLGTTNTLAAFASTLSTFFIGYFFSATNGNWAMSLFWPIAALQAVSVLLFTTFDATPVDFDAEAAK